jgi:hypothetical protein
MRGKIVETISWLNKKRFGLIALGLAVLVGIGMALGIGLTSCGEEEPKPTISEQQATQTGREFLDSIGYTTGKVLFTKLEEKTPNFYWYDLLNLEKPDIQGLRLCWVVRFEQAYRPGHFFEVWIDSHTGKVIGGAQCRSQSSVLGGDELLSYARLSSST